MKEISYGRIMIEGLILTPLKIIDNDDGNVLHALKENDSGYLGFSEAYFSEVNSGSIKAWKQHRKMTLNIVVPVGEIKFVIFDNRFDETGVFQEIILSQQNYFRLTIPPMVWLGFQGVSSNKSLLLNNRLLKESHYFHLMDDKCASFMFCISKCYQPNLLLEWECMVYS